VLQCVYMQKVDIVRDSELRCHLTAHIVFCSVLQCVAVCCIALQRVDMQKVYIVRDSE